MMLSDLADESVNKSRKKSGSRGFNNADERSRNRVVSHEEEVERVGGGKHLNECGNSGERSYDKT